MARGLNPDRTRGYVLKEERELPPEEQTEWLYRLLDCEAYWEAQDELMEHSVPRSDQGDVRTKVFSGKQERQVLKKGLVGVRNFFDEDGKEIVLREDANWGEKTKVISLMRPRWRTELARQILGESSLSEDAGKNSGSGSTPRLVGPETAATPIAATAA